MEMKPLGSSTKNTDIGDSMRSCIQAARVGAAIFNKAPQPVFVMNRFGAMHRQVPQWIRLSDANTYFTDISIR
jgi:hypothetical protein